MKELHTKENKENFLRCLLKIQPFKKMFNEIVHNEKRRIDRIREIKRCIIAREILFWKITNCITYRAIKDLRNIPFMNFSTIPVDCIRVYKKHLTARIKEILKTSPLLDSEGEQIGVKFDNDNVFLMMLLKHMLESNEGILS